MSDSGNDGRLVTWAQLSVILGPLVVILGLAIGAVTGWVNQLNEGQRRHLVSVDGQTVRNRERITDNVSTLQALDNRLDRLEDEQTVDPRDLSAIIQSLERRLDGLDDKTDRILERLGEPRPDHNRGP